MGKVLKANYSKGVSYLKKGEKYYRRDYNKSLDTATIKQLEFTNGKCEFYTSSHCYCTIEKEILDLLFLTDGVVIQE